MQACALARMSADEKGTIFSDRPISHLRLSIYRRCTPIDPFRLNLMQPITPPHQPEKLGEAQQLARARDAF
jgi:hypothetical protein